MIRTTRLLALAATLALFLAAPASAEVVSFSVVVNGANQVPPAATGGNGTLTAQYDTVTRILSWVIVYSGTSGPLRASHFHGPAGVGTNAGVALGLQGNLASPISGQATLTPEMAADLMAGLWYLNMHTAAFPGGEIRGQLIPPP